MRTVGRQPSPRVLFFGMKDEAIAKLQGQFPTSERIGALESVRLAEWDLLIMGPHVAPKELQRTRLSDHMFILSFGSPYVFQTESGAHVSRDGATRAREFLVRDDLPPSVERLVVSEVLPRQQEQPIQLGFLAGHDSGRVDRESLVPFLQTADGHILAGAFRRFGKKAQCWFLPSDEGDIVGWVGAAVSEWHPQFPEQFPFDLSWRSLPRWQSPAERRAFDELGAIDLERRRTLSDLASREVAARKAFTEASELAESSERLLLVGQGNELVRIVAIVFRELGFDVTEVDQEIAKKGDALEDLRLTDSEDPGWIALVEVRGYKKGAAVSDLLRIGRFSKRYLASEKTEPTRLFYVVNQWLGTDPSGRPVALSSNPNEVDEFSKDNGLVIDSRDLFALWNEIRSGQGSAEQSRRQLKVQLGRFTRGPEPKLVHETHDD